MQFMPSTWRRYGAGGDIESVHDAILAASRTLRAAPRAFLGYHQWQVYYGDTLLPEGYPASPPVSG